MKRLSRLLIVLVILLAQLTVMPVQADDLSGDFYYVENSDGISVTITGYTDTAPRDLVIIPATLSGKTVTTIGNEAFQLKSIQAIQLPEGLVSIGERAFYNNLLTSLDIPSSVKSIHKEAFAKNPISTLTLLEGLEMIGNQAFSENNLTSVVIPDSVTSVGEEAFYNNFINHLVLSNNLTEINTRAFQYNRLTSLEIPESVRTIKSYAFDGNRLADLEIPSTVTRIESRAFYYNALRSIRFLGTPVLSGTDIFTNQYLNFNNGSLHQWFTDEEFTDRWTNTVDAPMTIYASWEKNTVSFYSNGGSNVVMQIVDYNQKATEVIPPPTKTGNSFAGWYKDAALTHEWDFSVDIVIRDIILYGKWIANEYTVSFDSNGGTAVAAQTIAYDDTVDLPVAPTKAGHTFAGWYSDSSLTASWSFGTDLVKGPLTLYAKWTVNEYTVSFDSNGGTAVSDQTIAYDGIVTLPADPTRVGYTFEGWYSDEEVTTPWSFSTDLVKGTMTLYAKWTVNEYIVSFESNGGTAVAAQTIAYDDIVVLPVAPTKTGHTFDGWYSDEELTTPWSFGTDLVKGTMTLYAKWTVNEYIVSFESNGGTAVAAQTIAYDDIVTLPADPTRVGYTFDGWYSDEELTTPWDFGTDLVKGTMTLYAKWDKEMYTVTFDSNGGSAIAEQEIAFEERLAEPTRPLRSGYTFVGWFMDEELTIGWDFTVDVVIADMTMYAKWSRIYYPTVPEPEPEPEPEEPIQEEPVQEVCATSFPDISNHWAEYAIKDIASRCIIVGFPDGNFHPNAPLLRAHVAVMFTRALELSPEIKHTSFLDVPEDSPYYKSILSVTRANIFAGTNGFFYPDQHLTRAQMAKILVKAFKLPIGGQSAFQDVPSTHWAASYIATLEAHGLAFGEEGYYKPDQPVTRAEFVVFMYRVLRLK